MHDAVDIDVATDSEAGEALVSTASPRRRSRKRRQLAHIPARVPRFVDIGPMPTDDPLAMNAWMHRALGISAAQTIADPDLTEQQRRVALCDIASKMATLTDQSRIWRAESVVRGEAFQLNGAAGPQMEKADGEAVNPAPSGGTARRGRPRKRGLA